jgi:hypothetical protein
VHSIIDKFKSKWYPIFSILVITACTSKATTYTWDGGGANNNWTTSGNWDSAGAPSGSTGDIVFAGTTRLSVNGTWTPSINSITFASGAGSFNLSGGGYSLGADGITNNSANTQTINVQLSLSSDQTWIANTGALVLGSTYFNASDKNLTLAGSSSITINNNIPNVADLTLTGSGDRTITGDVSSSSGKTISIGSSGTNTFGGTISGASTVNLTGSGNTTVSGTITTASGGTVSVTNSGANNLARISGASSVTFSGTGSNTVSGEISMGKGGTVIISNSGPNTFGGQISNSSAITLSGTGSNNFTSGSTTTTTTLSVSNTGTNTFAGHMQATTINLTAGTNNFTNTGTSAEAGSGGLNINGTASVTFSGNVSGGTGGIHIDGTGDAAFNGAITGGSLTLASTYTGTTTLSGTGSKNISTTIVNGGTLIMDQLGGGDAINGSLTINDGGTVIFAGDNQVPSWTNVTLNEGSSLYLGNTSQTITNLIITGDSVLDFGDSGSQFNISGNITIANDITLTIINWNGDVDVFAGNNPGPSVVNIQYADSEGVVYATGTWGSGYITPGAPVPEPATYGLLIIGAGLGLFVWRRSRKPRD